jgi:Ca2+-binding RTX toxin-like protein
MWDNDVITVRSGVGSYAPRVYGGSGDDVIRATTQLHSATGQAVWGGPGNDAITLANVDVQVPVTNVARGEAGNDYITGSDGRDLLFGDEGNDMIRGGAGDDVLFGGAGNDRMYGHAGDDYFDGGLGKDRISGEDGYDFALEDKLDDVAGVEMLI